MQWEEIRQHYPQQWLLVEAVQAHSEANHRILDELAVVDLFPDSDQGLRRYIELHRLYPTREFYVLHTSRGQLDITEWVWAGIRPGC